MAGVGRRKTSPAAIAIDERHTAALNLRKANVSFLDIAGQLGYASEGAAYNAVMAALAKARQEPAEELRKMEVMRLDGMLEAISESVMAGDLDAINTALKVMAQRARLLGLERKDTPIKIKLPRLEKAQDAVAVVGALIEKVTAGEISPDDANRIAGLLGVFTRTVEAAELAEKLAQFEDMARESAEREKRNERN